MLFLKVLNIDLPLIKCISLNSVKIAASLNDISYRWCKRENAKTDALNEWKIYIFKIIDTRISYYNDNTHLLTSI